MKKLNLPFKYKSTNFFWQFISIIIGIYLILGGLGMVTLYVKIFGTLISLMLIGLVWVLKGRLRFPPGFFLYSLFLLIFLANTFNISQDRNKSLEEFLLFGSAGLFWILFYNLGQKFRQLDKLIVLLGIFFAGAYFYNNFFGNPKLVSPWSLYLQYSGYYNHNHIGDLWAVVLVVVSYHLFTKKNWWWWILVPLGIYLLAISQSRSAFVALAVGVVYLIKVLSAGAFEKKNQRKLALFLVAAAALFIFTGASKITLLSRPYFLQAIWGIYKNPQGVGVGNFGSVSQSFPSAINQLRHFSSVAHNVVLEILVGLGVLGSTFVFWLGYVLYKLWQDSQQEGIVYRAVFFALTANFFFDSTYFVPTLLWLWFISLGLAQTYKKV